MGIDKAVMVMAVSVMEVEVMDMVRAVGAWDKAWVVDIRKAAMVDMVVVVVKAWDRAEVVGIV